LVGRLFGWLVGRSVGWLVCWLVGRSVSELLSLPVSRSCLETKLLKICLDHQRKKQASSRELYDSAGGDGMAFCAEKCDFYRQIYTYPAVPLPCRSFPFDLHSAAVFDSHIPWHGMCESALMRPFSAPG
jgi:hypothetical protein